MLPRIEERFRIKRADVAAHFLQLQQAGAFGNEQANAKLDRRDIFRQGFGLDDAEEIKITLHRRPLRKRNECWMESHAKRAEGVDDIKKVLARVAFVESPEHGVIQIFHGADDEETARVAQRRQMSLVFSQVFDFYGDVVGYAGKFAV